MVSETRTRRVAHCVPRQVNYTTYTLRHPLRAP